MTLFPKGWNIFNYLTEDKFIEHIFSVKHDFVD